MTSRAEKFGNAKRKVKKIRDRVRNRPRLLKHDVVKCRLIELRAQHGLTIREAAEQVGISTAGWHAIEHGGNATMKVALDICDFFGVALGDIWSHKDA